MSSPLDLDVKYNEITDFLRVRQKLAESWQKTLLAVRVKVTEAAQDLDQEIGAKLKSDDYTYIDCQNVVEHFKTQDGEELNMFRQYKSARVQQWYKLVRLYQRDGVHLGELATKLNQNVTYEIPSLRREQQRLQSVIADLRKRLADHNRKAQDFHQRFKRCCAGWGIKGTHVKQELSTLALQLDGVYTGVAQTLARREVADAISFCVKFIAAVHSVPEAQIQRRFALIRHLALHGAETLVQFGSHFGVVIAESNSNRAETVVKEADEASIDWGSDDDEGLVEGETALQVPIEMLQSVAGEGDGWVTVESTDKAVEIEIDWDIEDETSASPVVVSGNPGAGGHNASPSDTIGATLVLEDVVSTDEDAEVLRPLAQKLVGENGSGCVLEPIVVRNFLANELEELLLFLVQRRRELRATDEVGAQLQAAMMSWDTDLSDDQLSSFEGVVQSAVDVLVKPRTQQLFLIKTSPSYVDRVAQSLLQQADLSTRMAEAALATQSKITQTEMQSVALTPQIAKLVAETKALKVVVESELSSVFGGVKVHVVGAVNEL